MTEANITLLTEALLRLRRACVAVGGTGPVRVVVDHATADFVQYAGHRIAGLEAPRTNREPTYVGTLVGVEIHTPSDRHRHVIREVKRFVEEQDGNIRD